MSDRQFEVFYQDWAAKKALDAKERAAREQIPIEEAYRRVRAEQGDFHRAYEERLGQ